MQSNIKTDDRAALTTAMEDNLLETLDYIARDWDDAQHERTPSLWWSITDYDFAIFNSVIGARLSPENADEAIAAAIERGRARNVSVLWWGGSHDEPDDLGDRLQAHGFLFGGEANCMKLDMTAYDLAPSIDGLTFREVTTEADAITWGQTMVAGFGMDDYAEQLSDVVVSGGMGPGATQRQFLGALDGEVVTSGSVTLSSGVAGLYNIAVVPDARSRGIGRAMTDHLMRVALAEGYQFAVLQASPMGLPLYEKMGFETFAPMRQYIWLPGEQGA